MKATITKVNTVKNTITLKADAKEVGSFGFLKEALYWVRVKDTSLFSVNQELDLTEDDIDAMNEID